MQLSQLRTTLAETQALHTSQLQEARAAAATAASGAPQQVALDVATRQLGEAQARAVRPKAAHRPAV